MGSLNWLPFDRVHVDRVSPKEGIYWIRSKPRQKIVYVGISHEGANIQGRLLAHLKGDNEKLNALVAKEPLEFAFCYAGDDLLQVPQAELFQISINDPECNGTGRDKVYPDSIRRLIEILQGRGKSMPGAGGVRWCPFLKENVRLVERREGIYWIRSRSLGVVLYVGRSFGGEDIRKRLDHHLGRVVSANKKQVGENDIAYYDVRDLEFAWMYAGENALQPALAEVFQIRHLQPICNTVGKDRGHSDSLERLLKWVQLEA